MPRNILNKLSVNLYDNDIQKQLYEHLQLLLHRQEGLNLRPIVALCIGSDRYTGDALGPLVGTYLEEHTACNVYGTLEQPVHAGNFMEMLNRVTYHYHHPIIIAVDACLGKKHEIGNIEIWQGGLAAGIAVGNRLPIIGDISVIGVVNSQSQMGYMDLQSTSLAQVMKLSKVIGEVIAQASANIIGGNVSAYPEIIAK